MESAQRTICTSINSDLRFCAILASQAGIHDPRPPVEAAAANHPRPFLVAEIRQSMNPHPRLYVPWKLPEMASNEMICLRAPSQDDRESRRAILISMQGLPKKTPREGRAQLSVCKNFQAHGDTELSGSMVLCLSRQEAWYSTDNFVFAALTATGYSIVLHNKHAVDAWSMKKEKLERHKHGEDERPRDRKPAWHAWIQARGGILEKVCRGRRSTCSSLPLTGSMLPLISG